MAEIPTELYDLVARLDHAAAVYNWPDCTEAARKIEALRAENTRLRDEVSDLDALRARVAEAERRLEDCHSAMQFFAARDETPPEWHVEAMEAINDALAALRIAGDKSGVPK